MYTLTPDDLRALATELERDLLATFAAMLEPDIAPEELSAMQRRRLILFGQAAAAQALAAGLETLAGTPTPCPHRDLHRVIEDGLKRMGAT